VEPRVDQGSPDATLIDRVRTKLLNMLADARHIEVKATGGIVTLVGSIRDSAQSRAAVLITHRVEGVRNVVNKLTIGGSALAATPAIRGAARRSKSSSARTRVSILKGSSIEPIPASAG
jgi:hypothetical protein